MTKARTDNFFNDGSRFQRVPYVTYTSTCPNENCLFITMPTSETYTLTFTARANCEPILLDVVRGVGNTCPDEAVRYLDRMLPQASVAMLNITPPGVEDIRYDHQGNGIFTSKVKPTAHVFAPAAWDTEGPIINFFRRHRAQLPCW